jgi:four helix bundle protein
MARTKSYRELIVWQKAMGMARSAYLLSRELPKAEAFGLVSQLRRAAVSVPSNIAEGHGRLSDSQMRYFLGNARGSLYELQSQLELAGDIGLLEEAKVRDLMEQGWEVARLINGLIASLAESRAAAPKSTDSANRAQRD